MNGLIGILFSSFLIAFSGAVMPGPVLSVTISESAKRGFWAGPGIIFGHGILELSLMALILLGLAEYLKRPDVIGFIGVAGGAVLFWLSFGMVKGLKGLSLDLAPAGSRYGGPVMAGILTSIANPYWTLWWVTIGLGYVAMAIPFGAAGIAFFFVGHIAADLAWYSAVSFVVSRGKRLINDRMYQCVIFGCALILFFFAIYFSVMGVKTLLNSNL